MLDDPFETIRWNGIADLAVLRGPRPGENEIVGKALEPSAFPNRQGAIVDRMSEATRRDVREAGRYRIGRRLFVEASVERGVVGHPDATKAVRQQFGRNVLPATALRHGTHALQIDVGDLRSPMISDLSLRRSEFALVVGKRIQTRIRDRTSTLRRGEFGEVGERFGNRQIGR